MDDPRPAPTRGRGRRPDLDPVTERRLLLKAAVAVLQRSATHEATLNEILAEAQLSTRAFYRQFSSTTELLDVLRAEELAKVRARLEKAVATATTPRAALEAWIDEQLDIRFDSRRARRVSLVRGIGGADLRARADAVAALAPGLEAILADGRAAGAFPRTDPEADARTICRMVLDLVSTSDPAAPSAARDPAAPSAAREAVRDHLLRFALGGLT